MPPPGGVTAPSAPRRARGPGRGGGHHRGWPGGPHPWRSPRRAHDLPRPAPRSRFAGRAPPARGDPARRQAPCPSGADRRRLGGPRAGHTQAAPPLTPGPPPQRPPGPQRDGPRAAVPPRSAPEGPRHTGHPRRGGDGPGPGGRAGGQCPAAAEDARRRSGGWRWPPTPPVGHGPRQRRRPGVVSPSAACSGGSQPAGLARGRPPTAARPVGPTPRRAAGASVGSSRLRRCRWTPRASGPRQAAHVISLLPRALDPGSHSNARFQARRRAGAERTL